MVVPDAKVAVTTGKTKDGASDQKPCNPEKVASAVEMTTGNATVTTDKINNEATDQQPSNSEKGA